MKNIILKVPIILGLINLFGYLMYYLSKYFKDGLIKDVLNTVYYVFHPNYMVLFSGLVSMVAIIIAVTFGFWKVISIKNIVVSIILNLAYIILYIHWFVFHA